FQYKLTCSSFISSKITTFLVFVVTLNLSSILQGKIATIDLSASSITGTLCFKVRGTFWEIRKSLTFFCPFIPNGLKRSPCCQERIRRGICTVSRSKTCVKPVKLRFALSTLYTVYFL